MDNKKLDVSATLFLPWICVDGMNEKGLAVSALYVDVKEGESPTYQTKEGQPQATATELLRYILDGCANVDEAIQLAQEYNMINTSGNDYHLFASDKNKSVILEWRYNELYVVECDIATNFFLAFDDAEDIYYGDLLKEAWTGPADTEKEYQYGYGHGFARFKEIASSLDKQEYLNPEEGLDLLSRVAQTYKDDGVSQETHYSLVYNHQNSTVDVYLRKNYDKVYSFNFDAK